MVRARLLVVLAVGALVSTACPPGPSSGAAPAVLAPTGGVSAAAPSPRQVLSRDVDRPGAPDCDAWRYQLPDTTKLPVDYTNHEDYEFTSKRTPHVAGSKQFLCGQRGPATDLAWEVSKGRDDVLIAVLDSGIEWRGDKMKDLVTKAYLNAAELPVPLGASSHDANGDGVFDVSDYADDPRVTDRNDTGMLDPEDLILTPEFNDGVDDDGNGYVDDISGWDVLFDDNNPLDDVDYGHGTGEARDSTAADGNGGSVGTCPQCRFLPVRVGDSFITDGGRFAAGVIFGLDSGADVIQEALGAINNPPQAQAAIDAAYERGVPIVASMADEASKHANLPVVLNRTIAVNSITSWLPPALTNLIDKVGGKGDYDYLSLNGCTNYGAITWVSVPSTSCSSGATGLGAGLVGLVESVARDSGVEPHPVTYQGGPSDNVLSANEMAQLMRGTADDVDFATPHPPYDPPNNGGVENTRYPTTPGWDATFGFGRINTFEMVRAVQAGEIPPEADMVAPAFFDVLPVTGTMDVAADLAAYRSSSYSYRVQWTTGLQGPPHPGSDVWRTVAEASGLTAPSSGTLATIDLAEVAAALPDGGRGAPITDGESDEDRFAVRVRVVVTDAEGRTAVAQRQVFVHDDPDLERNDRIDGVGATSPVFADVDTSTDGDELVVATDDGRVHVLGADGDDVDGWPQRTRPVPWWHTGSRTVQEDDIATPHAAVGVGAPVTADLDGDGSIEIAVTDGNGDLTVWNHDGTLVMRASVDPRFSRQSATDRHNRLKPGFLASPAAADLDGDGEDELVAAALDRHLYAWHLDGSLVDGFPVHVVDPDRVESVDPETHRVTFDESAGPGDGGELIVTPALGDLNGDGRPEIVVGAQEQYEDESPAVFPGILAIPGLAANTRVYAIHPDGNDHPGGPFLDGWPVPLQMIKGSVLPLIGNGVNVQAAIGQVDDDPANEVVISSSAGPIMVLDADGRTPYARRFGVQLTLDWMGEPFGYLANSRDGGAVVSAFGGPSLGDLTGDGRLEVVSPTVGVAQAADQLLPGRQPGDTQLMAWDTRTRHPIAGFPHRTRDLGFFVTPAIVDVDGDGRAEVVAGHGVNLVDATNADGVDAPGWPKLTGAWVVGTPGFGDLDGDGRAEMAVTRRDGRLMVWRTKAPTSSLDGWSRFGHDGRNSGNASP